MITKSMKLFMVFAFATLVWAGFGANESVADKEPDFSMSASEYSADSDSYDGDIIVVDGYVTSMHSTDNGVSIVLDDTVNCYFRGDEADEAFLKNVGDYVCVKGKSNGFTGLTTLSELNYCTLN